MNATASDSTVQRAGKILAIRIFSDDQIILSLMRGDVHSVETVSPEWLAAQKPQVGGFFVVYVNGRRAYVPRY